MTEDFLKTNKNQHEDKFKENFIGTDWLGIVVDNNDDQFLGRCKIRVFEKYDELEDELLPWAFPVSSDVFAGGESKGNGSFSYPKIGTLVRVRFQNGDLYHPEYHMVQNLNEKMKGEIKVSYENCQVVVFDEDEDLKIIYTQVGGLLCWHKGSYMRIDKETHITLAHVGESSIQTFIDGDVLIKTISTIIEESPMIHLDSPDTRLGPNAFQSACRCESLMQLLSIMAAAIDAKVPTTPGVVAGAVNSYQAMICSKTVDVAQ